VRLFITPRANGAHILVVAAATDTVVIIAVQCAFPAEQSSCNIFVL
jgi:hypothetical protein